MLDIDVVSELRKPSGDATVRRWFAAAPDAGLFLSVLTIGEIRRGIARLRRRDPAQAAVYGAWLATLRRDDADRILPVTVAIAEQWGRLHAGDPLPVVDGLLAATARVHGSVLVTRNTADVARTGVQLLDPLTLP